MPVGFELINSNGQYLIDGTYQNLQLDSKQSVSVGNGISRSFASLSTPVAGLYATGYASISRLSGDSQWRWGVSGTSGLSTEVFLFGSRSAAPSSNNSGLQIFNEQGSLVFDNSLANLRIVDFVTVDAQATTETVVTYTAGRKYAVVPCTTALGQIWNNGLGMYQIYRVHFKTVGASVYFNTELTGLSSSTQGGYPGWPVRYPTFIIIDVTSM